MAELQGDGAIERRARVVWQGGLSDGDGRLSTESGTTNDVRMTWDGRVSAPAPAPGATSPEELIAAAHAGCYSMALSHVLGRRGLTPERLDVQARCLAGEREGAFAIVAVRLEVDCRVPGVDQVFFDALVAEAERRCPVSNALRGNIEIRVSARLQPVG